MGGGGGAEGEECQRTSPPIEVVEVGQQMWPAGLVVGVGGAVAVAVVAAADVGDVDRGEFVEAVGADVGELEDVAGLAQEGSGGAVLVDAGVLADDEEDGRDGGGREGEGKVVEGDADGLGDPVEGAEGAGGEGREDGEGTDEGGVHGVGGRVGGSVSWSGQPGVSEMGGDWLGGDQDVMALRKVEERRWMVWVRTSRTVWRVSWPAWLITAQRMKG